MKAVTAVLAAVPLVVAHGQHHFDLDDKDQGMTYAERHVSSDRLCSSRLHTVEDLSRRRRLLSNTMRCYMKRVLPKGRNCC